MDTQLEYGIGTAVFVLEHASEKLSPEEADRAFERGLARTSAELAALTPDAPATASDPARVQRIETLTRSAIQGETSLIAER